MESANHRTEQRLIATWLSNANPETDAPDALRWEDGSPATMADFTRIDSSSQSDPHEIYSHDGRLVAVEFGYLTLAAKNTDAGMIYDWPAIEKAAVDRGIDPETLKTWVFEGVTEDLTAPQLAQAYLDEKDALRVYLYARHCTGNPRRHLSLLRARALNR